MQKVPKTVDAYIAAFPKETQTMMKQLRRAIKAAAPKAEEKISYGIVGYYYYGRLVYFGGFRKHVSFYGWGRTVKQHAKEIAKYRTSTGTLQFPIGTKVPAPLITKLVKSRMKENEERMNERTIKKAK